MGDNEETRCNGNGEIEGREKEKRGRKV